MRARYVIALLMMGACAATHLPASDFGSQYLGVRYVNDPLGEGAGYDGDPLIRDDAFDCMTYVETVLACGDQARLTQIRYDGGLVDFTRRNHFFSADWVKNNSNLVENVSADFADTAIRSGTINKSAWFQKVHGIKADFAPVNAKIEYVPYSKLGEVDVVEPMLVAFVVDNPATVSAIGSDILVSHVGFLLPGGALRHASSSVGRVTTIDFSEYVAARRMTKTNLGVAFFKIKEFCE